MSLRERFLDVAARRRLAGSTQQCYLAWIDNFLRFARVEHRWRHPEEMRERDVEPYLNGLARLDCSEATPVRQPSRAGSCGRIVARDRRGRDGRYHRSAMLRRWCAPAQRAALGKSVRPPSFLIRGDVISIQRCASRPRRRSARG